MQLSKNILGLCVSLLIAMHAAGQGVVVHSDPRLSLLVKQTHNMEPLAANLPIHKAAPKTSRTSMPVPHTASGTAKDQPATTVTKGQPMAAASGPVTAPAPITNVKVSSDDASTTGHAAGWSPPLHRKVHVIYSGKGYRVQIYNGPDRARAMEIKTEFMRAYPGMRTYLTYMSPCFRVKVGDYRTRNEALGMLHEANSTYSPCMIVPDLITISTY